MHVLVTLCCILGCSVIYLATRPPQYIKVPDDTHHQQAVKELQENIQNLEVQIKEYKIQIEEIARQRDEFKTVMDKVIRENENTNIELTNGDWDTNIKFLSKYLSEKDSLGKGHVTVDNKASTDKNQYHD